MVITKKIAALRNLMRKHNLDAYIIPSGDTHNTEYIQDYWRTWEWISGFTGSACTIVITAGKAGLWTDGRYYTQAEKELCGTGIELFKKKEQGVKSYTEFIADNLANGGRLGFDGRVVTAYEFETIKKALDGKSITYSYQHDLIGELWHDRPSLAVEPAFNHGLIFAGKPASEKLQDVRAGMKKNGYTYYLVSALDSVAWLLNIRGKDSPNMPVVYAHILINETEANVYIDSEKASAIYSSLIAQGFLLYEYTDLPTHLKALKTDKLYYNSFYTNIRISETIPAGITAESNYHKDIIPLLKAVKTDDELTNIRNAFIKDCTAIVKMLIWLDGVVLNAASSMELRINEGDIVRVLESIRREQPHYLCESFPTISAYGGNAALAHYRSGTTGTALQSKGLLLIDAGGQYLDGTTDTTRTIVLGDITDEMRHDFTLVLKGHIALDRAVFPAGTTGSAIDILARQYLWESGQNYNHGTGHGLGHCLSAHEGPHFIGQQYSATALAPGMLVSNEPSQYKENCYGIRIENILLVKENSKTAAGTFLSFESLTFCPIDLRAVDTTMLTEIEIDWLNNYHQRTYEALSPYLNTDECMWLKNATRQI